MQRSINSDFLHNKEKCKQHCKMHNCNVGSPGVPQGAQLVPLIRIMMRKILLLAFLKSVNN
jgi:hypothetical protein